MPVRPNKANPVPAPAVFAKLDSLMVTFPPCNAWSAMGAMYASMPAESLVGEFLRSPGKKALIQNVFFGYLICASECIMELK